MEKQTSCLSTWGDLEAVETLLRPYPQASINERTAENFRLLHEKDEDVEDLNVIYKLILPHQEESKDELKKIQPENCLDLTTGGGEHFCEG